MDSSLWVSYGRFIANIYLIIIVKVFLFVVTILGFQVRQDKREMCIAVSIFIDCSLDCCGSKNVKISVPSDQEVNILFLRYQVMQELVKAVFYLSSTLYVL